MNRLIPLSFITVASLYANEVQLQPITVESTYISDVAQKAQLSADVAQALKDSVPSVDMSRRSGIANDILIRGQKRDNISVEVDGTKVYGACPNRMDPPISHIVSHQIQDIKVIEGPYDVENFGTLSGGIKIITKKPTQKVEAQLNIGVGSFGYKKFGATISGGTQRVRASLSVSKESSDQYKDGNGDTLATQVDNYAAKNPSDTLLQKRKYQAQYHDIQAYDKKSAMAKVYISTLKNQELRLSVTANRSTGILYANTPMDAAYDDSNIYNLAYNIDTISNVYKNVNLQYYHSDVEHPMNTQFRVMGTSMYKTNQLQTSMDGLKLKNSFDIASYTLLIGLDASQRTWHGQYFMTSVATGVQSGFTPSLTHTQTTNRAIFAKLDKKYTAFDFTMGARFDATNIKPDDVAKKSNDYRALSANILSTYHLNSENKIFLDLGQASRVPDARELYIVPQGNQDLNQVTNQEVDLGYELQNSFMSLKLKTFYSMLHDYIYYNKTANSFVNVNATLYGGELTASLYATDDLSFDLAASYKVGKKDKALAGQTGTNMADIAPLRGNIAAHYEYMNNSVVTLEFVASDRWSQYDKENGEQELASWNILNTKVKHAINKKFDFTLGVNNLFNETYIQSNSSTDLTLLTTGSQETMLLNEPGRYMYTNLDFKF